MKSRLTSLAAMGAVVGALPAAAQQFCTSGSDGRMSLGFDVKPSLVVHSAGVLDATRGDVGADGDAAERAFSFRRTIDAILESVPAELGGGAVDDDMRRAFVQSMIDSFATSGKQLNAEAGVLMPFDSRSEATELTAEALLDDASPNAMKPLALFNRLDMADAPWTHCGEHRIVYGRTPTDGDRLTIIFEAMVPNPAPEEGAEGCRRVAEFWAGLTGLDEAEQARRLSEFYYEGVTGHADGDLSGPVVDFRNYGGDGHRGQVRANAFMQQPWQLREWLTQLTLDEDGEPVVFVPVTVKDNPLAELWSDDIMAHPDLVQGNIPAALTTLHGQFIQSVTGPIGTNLLSEGSSKHRAFVLELEDYDLGASPVTEDTVLLNTIAIGADDRFNEHQSVSQGATDVPSPGTSVTMTTLLSAAGAMPRPGGQVQTGQVLLDRALAVTCGGCHMTAARSQGFTGPGRIVSEKSDGTVVRWPDIHGDLFVHVSEQTRELSPALEDHFLPFRRYAMGRYLCDTLEPAQPEPEPEPQPYAALAMTLGTPSPVVENPTRYVDGLIQSYVTEAEATQPAGLAQPATGLEQMDTSSREAMTLRMSRFIDAMREAEREQPGAFYETRRPH